jgi:hypothetical protein
VEDSFDLLKAFKYFTSHQKIFEGGNAWSNYRVKLPMMKNGIYLCPLLKSLPTNVEEGEQYQFSITGDGVAITKFDERCNCK